MSQYGVYKSLVYIHISKLNIRVGDTDQRYKNIYFHFGLIFEIVENLAKNMILAQHQLQMIKLSKSLQPFNKPKIIKSIKKRIDKKYEKGYLLMIKHGIPLWYQIQTTNFLFEIIPKRCFKFRREYTDFVNMIKSYRNFYIHNPGVDIVIINKGKLLALKKEHIKDFKYRYWSILKKNILSQNKTDHFEDPVTIVNNDFEIALKYLNRIWNYFIKSMDKLKSNKDYPSIFYGFNKSEFIDRNDF